MSIQTLLLEKPCRFMLTTITSTPLFYIVFYIDHFFWETFPSLPPSGLSEVQLFPLVPCASLFYYIILMKKIRGSSQSRDVEAAQKEWPDRQINLVSTILYNDIFGQCFFCVFVLFCLIFSLQRELSTRM